TSLGLQYLNGVGTTRNTQKAAHWFEVAAKSGHTQAAYQTGVMYLEGEGVETDSLMARYWLLRAREDGDPRASRLLADFATF
ncbi:MAG: tetratricopeptide repeat protein, partial [Pseudomonadota bacterium]